MKIKQTMQVWDMMAGKLIQLRPAVCKVCNKDITNKDAVSFIYKDGKPEYVIHLKCDKT